MCIYIVTELSSSSEISAKKLRLRILEICKSCCESMLCFSNMRYTLMRVQPSLFANQVTVRSCICSSSLMRSPIFTILSWCACRHSRDLALEVLIKKDVGVCTSLILTSDLRIASTQRISNAVSPRRDILLCIIRAVPISI